MQRIKLMTQRDSIVIKFLCLYSCVFARSRVFSLIRMLFHWPTLSLSLSVAFAISLANEIISITLFAESFFFVRKHIVGCSFVTVSHAPTIAAAWYFRTTASHKST